MRITTPSARNLEIFHRLVEDGASLREVGEEFQLSHNRIVEIREQVERWRKHVAPDWEAGRNRRQDSVALCNFHQQRAGRAYQVMMNAFRNSGERRTDRDASVTIVTTPGDPKYVLAALRCSREEMHTSLVLAKLPDEYFTPPDVELVPMTAEELALEAAEEARRAGTAPNTSEPPVSVLTPSSPAPIASTTAAPAAARATSSDNATSDIADLLRQQARHDRRKKISPVQPTAANEEKRRELAAKLLGA